MILNEIHRQKEVSPPAMDLLPSVTAIYAARKDLLPFPTVYLHVRGLGCNLC